MHNIYFCKPVKLKILCFACCCSFAYASFVSLLLWFTLRKAEESSLRFALVLRLFAKQTKKPKSREKGRRAEAQSQHKGPFFLLSSLWCFGFGFSSSAKPKRLRDRRRTEEPSRCASVHLGYAEARPKKRKMQ